MGDSGVGRTRAAGLETAEADGVFEDQGVPKDGGGKKEGVDAVEDAAVTREEGAGVLDAGAALDGGLEQIAELGGDVEDGGKGEGLPDGFADVQQEIAADGEDVAHIEQAAGDGEGAKDGGDGAFPGFARGDARGELVFADGAADVESGDIAGPDGEHEEDDERGAIFLLPEEGDEGERISNPNEAEEALRGVWQDLDGGGAEAIPGEEREGEEADDGKLGVDGEAGQGDGEDGGRGDNHPGPRDAEAGVMGLGADLGQREELKGGELGDEQRGDGDHPELAKEDEGEDGKDEDEGGEDAFHGSLLRIRGVWLLVGGVGRSEGKWLEIGLDAKRYIVT